MLDLHRLRIFVYVARLGSFTRAASLLNMTQPTISQQIAALEGVLGVQLIDRDTRKMRLTPSGTVLYDYGERLLNLADEAVAAVKNEAGLTKQLLKLGVGHTLATYILPDLLSRYRTQYADYRVRLSTGNTGELLSKLSAGDIDIALVGSPAEHPDILVTPFMYDQVVVIVSPQDEWAGLVSVTLGQIASRVLLTREPGSALYTTVSRLFGDESLAQVETILLGETEAIKRSVELGLGVALIQKIAVEREVQQGTLRTVALSGADDTRTYLIAVRKRYIPGDAVAAFMNLPPFNL
ncbi:MAG: LysR family transcriptional regulator [Chloroflexi bacterium]|nr:LysR family transcriptional regulator [Chloroflexota bacterium]MCC6896964.1 LysR family transcriptional regulator [Anaerolineae bacterium]